VVQNSKIGLLVFEDPGVFAASALRGIDYQRSFFHGYAGQAAGYDVYFVAEQNVGAQVYMAGLEPGADETGGP